MVEAKRRQINQSSGLQDSREPTNQPLIERQEIDPSASELVHGHLQRLIVLLEDDTRAPAPHLCLQFAAASYVYTSVSRIAISLAYEPITREAVSLFTILVDSDEANLLATDRFADTLMTFVDAVLGYNGYVATAETQSEALELIFGIAAKIRLEPELLPVWFRKAEATPSGKDAQNQGDFPLCHQFLSHVYNEGRAGDFARTGLLYILESASNSSMLEEWIASSDLPTLMASGLGALYSQLSRYLTIQMPFANIRKLTIAHDPTSLPNILAISAHEPDESIVSGAESFASSDFKARLTTFMSYMVFWQDVLEHCRSAEIKATLLDRFRIEFLQQILYPSLLESSDVDGGSSVAVLTYLHRILDSVNHPDLIHLMLHYLFALPGPIVSQALDADASLWENRSVSWNKTVNTNDMNLVLFNLTDLILTNMGSSNPETVVASLRLLTVVLHKHHSYAVSSLVRTVQSNGVVKFIGTLHAEMQAFFSLAEAFGGAVRQIDYANSLYDAQTLLEAHSCSLQKGEHEGELGKSTKSNRDVGLFHYEARETERHTIDARDPLLVELLGVLATFLTNSAEINLALTDAISHLAICPFTNLSGWLTPIVEIEPAEDSNEGEDGYDSEELELRRIDAFRRTRKTTRSVGQTPILQTLQSLAESVKSITNVIAGFENLVQARRRQIEDNDPERIKDPAPLTPRHSMDKSDIVPLPQPHGVSPSPVSNDVPPSSPRGRTLAVFAGQGRSSSLASRFSATPKPNLTSESGSRNGSQSPVKKTKLLQPGQTEKNADIVLAAAQNYNQISIDASGRATLVTPSTRPDRRLQDHEDEGDAETSNARSAPLTRILTNIVILQNFVVELAAIVHIRSSVLDSELKFT